MNLTELRGEYFINKYFDNKSLNIDFGLQSFQKVRNNSKLTFLIMTAQEF